MTESGDGAVSRWIEAGDLLILIQRDVRIAGDESPEVVLTREPHFLVPVTDPATPALDVQPYRVRLARWESGQGPRLTGMRDFVHALETLTVPTRSATISGETTTYTFQLDAPISRVLACVAVDAPATV